MNLKHLRYFAEIARRGSVSAAARALHLAPQTLSAQLLVLEESVGQPLFERIGRRLVLTPQGATALDYANAIFALGDELASVLQGRARPRRQLLRVGVMDSVPKLLTLTILQPLVDRHRGELELHCSEDDQAGLLGRVATGEIDLMLADAPVPSNLTRGLQSVEVASSGMSFVATRALATRLARTFPQSLDDAPFLAGSAPGSLIGQALEAWFSRHKLRPGAVGNVDDSALLMGFASAGLGVIAVPSSIEREVLEQYRLGVVGRTDQVRQTVFMVRARGRRAHPLVAELEAALPARQVHRDAG
jgi:LysR family transcriptional regulator, transcriptional activator of nhaA